MNKKKLRQIYLEKRRALAPDELKAMSLRIAERFFREFDLEKINYLHCFLPIERFNEIDTRLILHRVWFEHSHIETLVPRVDFKKGELENLKFTPLTELVQNAWMIDEPVANELVESAKIDLVLVPLLCFDTRGFRVGYGKGFYDKFLKNCRADCVKVGLSSFPPVENFVDADDFDVRMDYVLTPDETIRMSDVGCRIISVKRI